MLGEAGDGVDSPALKYNIVINPFFDANIHRFQNFIQPFNVIHIILCVVLDFQKCMINNRIIFLGIKVRDFNEYQLSLIHI